MTTPTTLTQPLTGERSRVSMDLIRTQTLDRLRQRRKSVQQVIWALEDYQKSRNKRKARRAEALRAGLHIV